MKRFALSGAVVLCASAAAGAYADGGGFLDFEDPETDSIIDAPNPYHGTTWSTTAGDGLSHLGVMDIDWYNTNYGASLAAVSGDQVGWSRFGEDNISVSFSENMIIKDFYLTPWFGFGPAVMQADFYDDGVLVDSIAGIAMVPDSWTHVIADLEADQVIFRNFGGGQWWLIEDFAFNKVPAPGALALLGLAAMGARRRRNC